MVSCWAYQIEGSKSICQRIEKSNCVLTTDDTVTEFINKRNFGFFIVPTMIMIRGDIHKQFDENLKFGCDIDFILSFMEDYRFYCIGVPLVNYYIHDANSSTFDSYRSDKRLVRAGENEDIFRKHRASFLKNKKGASIFMRNIGTLVFLSSGDRKKSLRYYAIAIKLHPFDFQNYIVPLLSLFGVELFAMTLKFKRNVARLEELWFNA